MQKAVRLNALSGLCLTKLDVLDGLETLRICTGYRLDGKLLDGMPVSADELERCEPVYEDMPGWAEKTASVTRYEDLPQAARDYIERLEKLVGVEAHMISTGPERTENIVRFNPFS